MSNKSDFIPSESSMKETFKTLTGKSITDLITTWNMSSSILIATLSIQQTPEKYEESVNTLLHAFLEIVEEYKNFRDSKEFKKLKTKKSPARGRAPG